MVAAATTKKGSMVVWFSSLSGGCVQPRPRPAPPWSQVLSVTVHVCQEGPSFQGVACVTISHSQDQDGQPCRLSRAFSTLLHHTAQRNWRRGGPRPLLNSSMPNSQCEVRGYRQSKTITWPALTKTETRSCFILLRSNQLTVAGDWTGPVLRSIHLIAPGAWEGSSVTGSRKRTRLTNIPRSELKQKTKKKQQ